MNTAPTFSEWDLTDQPCTALAEDDHCWCISPVLTYSALFWVMCNKEPQTALLNLWQKCFILTAGSSANNKMSLIKWVQWDDRMDLHSNRQMGQHPRKPPEVFFHILRAECTEARSCLVLLGPAWSWVENQQMPLVDPYYVPEMGCQILLQQQQLNSPKCNLQ